MMELDDVEQLLKSLHLTRIAEVLDEELARAQKADATYIELLARLLREQWQSKQTNALEWRIKRARLPVQWTLESFPYKRQPGVNRRQINTLAGLEFVPKSENIVFIGPTGVGKTGIATGLTLKALQNGYRARYVKAQELFDDLYASLADRSTSRLIKQLARVEVLFIDELGYLTIRPEQANAFFKLMEDRYTRHPTIITTNLVYDEWYALLGNKGMVDALLSRLRHRCHTITIDGPSLRDPQG